MVLLEHDGVGDLEPREEPGALEHHGVLPIAEVVEASEQRVAEARHNVGDVPLRANDERLRRPAREARSHLREEDQSPVGAALGALDVGEDGRRVVGEPQHFEGWDERRELIPPEL